MRLTIPTPTRTHSIDIPVCKLSSGKCPEPAADDNAVWAIEDSDSTLEAPSSTTTDKARALRFLVHIVGDVHEPLHAADYFDAQFPAPTGDRGGNSWQIAGARPATNLHSLWDQGLGQWSAQLRRPLNATGTAWVAALSAKVRGLFPQNALAPFIAEHNVSQWAVESHALAETFVYTAPQAPTAISAKYIATGKQLALQQLAIAGYRLATALELVLSAPRDAVYARVRARQ